MHAFERSSKGIAAWFKLDFCHSGAAWEKIAEHQQKERDYVNVSIRFSISFGFCLADCVWQALTHCILFFYYREGKDAGRFRLCNECIIVLWYCSNGGR